MSVGGMLVLPQRLRQLRNNKKMTQKKLAEKLGVGLSTVGSWETGDRSPDHEMLVKIADFFDVSIDSLLGRHNFDAKVDIESERLNYLSSQERLAYETIQTLKQAVSDGLLTEEQAEISLEVFQQTIEILMKSNKRK
jgi:transcriptional regulator with XRE-family HTH domain